MRLGLKIFIVTFSLTVITMNIVGLNLINSSYETNIKNAIDKYSANINNILDNFLVQSSDPVIKSNYDNNSYTKIFINDNLFLTNFPKNYEIIENKLKSNLKDNIAVYISDENLFMALKNNAYTIVTMSNISDIYKSRDIEIENFIQISLIVSVTIAIVLSLLVSLITRKIKTLNTAVKKIESGDYSIVIPDLGNDEIGEFAKSFNNMSASIQNNINEIETISENRRIFIGNLTHEIRTPLTSIIGYSSLIKDKKIADLNTINSYAGKIYDEGKYIESMRDKLMNILTLDSSKIVLKKTDISLYIKDLIDEFKEIFPDTKFILEIEANINKKIDKTLFKSLIINLIKNSINASDDPQITISLNNQYLSITDNGKGIPESELERIKEPFYTLNKDRNRKSNGMGLGLPLCLNIIDIHKWKMDIKSIVDKGTTITICFRR